MTTLEHTASRSTYLSHHAHPSHCKSYYIWLVLALLSRTKKKRLTQQGLSHQDICYCSKKLFVSSVRCVLNEAIKRKPTLSVQPHQSSRAVSVCVVVVIVVVEYVKR